ncbi:MAG TPA: glycosyltransferase family 9 protein [Rhodocyclaceae bacterium]|nr:glycosyltransferase family 9 protein [Rhodocyclaceae bacterium]
MGAPPGDGSRAWKELAPARILFIQVSRIGDTLFATPTLRAIAQAWPDAQITALAHPNRAEVLEHLPFLHRVGSITKKTAPWRGRWGGRQYDLAFVLGFDEALVAYALRVAHRVVAFRQKDEGLNARLFRAVPEPRFQARHAVEYCFSLAESLGLPMAGRRLAFQVLPAEAQAARERLRQAGFADAHPLVGLQAASFPTRSYRDWPVDHFVQLANRISARWPGARFLIYGGSAEKAQTDALKAALGDRALLLAGKLTLRETAAVMGCTDLYVGVDTGPTHIMSTFDIPMVGLYHATSGAAQTGPCDHPAARLIDHPLCGRGGSDHSSMADIPVEQVYAAVEAALAAKEPAWSA